MKNIKYVIFLWLVNLNNSVFALDWEAWILWWTTTEKIKNWDLHVSDIPEIIRYAIDFLMWIAWTISIIFIIIWAFKIALWSLEWEKTKWKQTIFYALGWFVLASLSWIILKLIIDNFT